MRIRKYIEARLTKHSILISSIISSWRGYNGGKMGSRRYVSVKPIQMNDVI